MVDAVWNAYMRLECEDRDSVDVRKLSDTFTRFSNLMQSADASELTCYASFLGEDIELHVQGNVVQMYNFLNSHGSAMYPSRNPYIINFHTEQEMEAIRQELGDVLINTDYYVVGTQAILSPTPPQEGCCREGVEHCTRC